MPDSTPGIHLSRSSKKADLSVEAISALMEHETNAQIAVDKEISEKVKKEQ
jgi:hypothetical protein